ncbi:MAG: hypothetical protein CMN85_10840 [Spongiibacteraceae bacterium]|uniref:hypothetical protein n=1 Tax=uncultured Haliea sp. TaxID=622616 RepID=UPI000C4A0EE1|nr:hypothetical protein [Spongiibacteraceae bacterium]|tara:strand:+ start:870 stop:1229 length:360 start_codon:yes stop_codon:yes gene_type:complete
MSDSKKEVAKVLSRSEILEAQDMSNRLIEVPEWGGSVYVGMMRGHERDAFELAMAGGAKNIRAKLVADVCQDSEGKRLFTDADVELLGEKSAKALQRVYNVAVRMNGFTDRDIDTLEKN